MVHFLVLRVCLLWKSICGLVASVICVEWTGSYRAATCSGSRSDMAGSWASVFWVIQLLSSLRLLLGGHVFCGGMSSGGLFLLETASGKAFMHESMIPSAMISDSSGVYFRLDAVIHLPSWSCPLPGAWPSGWLHFPLLPNSVMRFATPWARTSRNVVGPFIFCFVMH